MEGVRALHKQSQFVEQVDEPQTVRVQLLGRQGGAQAELDQSQLAAQVALLERPMTALLEGPCVPFEVQRCP